MTSSLRILFHIPTRSRPDRARTAIQNIIDNCVDTNYLILVSCDINDEAMTGFTFQHPKVLIHWGTSLNKIHACNRSIHLIKDWDILVASSDDMMFQVEGFDNVIRYSFRSDVLRFATPIEDYNYNLNQFVHFSDGNQGANVCTLSIMGSEYYNRDNYVYHPDYENLWCDVEAGDVAKIRGCYKYMGNDLIIFRHLHPAWGYPVHDDQYKAQDNLQTSERDKSVYLARKERNFDL